MGPIHYFDADNNGALRGSSFGEPDGTEHAVALLEGNGYMILRVTLADSDKTVDLLFAKEQAIEFTEAAGAIIKRLSALT